MDVAIVGGGFAGLAVAYALTKRHPALDWHLFEASDRLGGKVKTERIVHQDGEFLVEAGPDAMLTTKPWGRDLAVELGLGQRLLPINSLPAPAAIVKHGRIIDLPDGIALAAPTKLIPFARTRLLSPSGKLRAAADILLPARRQSEDESVGGFIRRRLGREMLDWIAEPMMAGIYNADPDDLSLRATFPRFEALEQTHRSLIRGLRATRPSISGSKNVPVFETLRGGMQELPDALIARVGNRCRTDAPVSTVAAHGDRYAVSVAGDAPIFARSVVLAAPASETARLLDPVAPTAASEVKALRTLSAGTLSLACRTEAIGRPPNGYGLVIPAREGLPINAITIASRKFPGRAPAGWTLLRVFFGGTRSQHTMQVDDTALLQVILNQLRTLIDFQGEPVFHRIQRWQSGSPQYDVGHLERVARIEARLPPGIVVTGSAFHGVGLPDIARDAIRAASTTAASLAHPP